MCRMWKMMNASTSGPVIVIDREAKLDSLYFRA